MKPLMPIRNLVAGLLFVGLFSGFPPLLAQQTTEQFIPIGKSPGISHQYSYFGPITELDRAAGTLVVQTVDGNKSIRLSPSTRIWLDRSKNKKSSLKASLRDLEIGKIVEVMHSLDDENLADWIKIES